MRTTSAKLCPAIIWLFSAVMVGSGCDKTQPPPGDQKANHSTSTQGAAGSAGRAPVKGSGPDMGDAPVPCGLPAQLLQRGWPRELSPTQSGVKQVGVESSDAALPKPAFRVGVIPDTQYYTLCRNQHFATQAKWLATQADQLALKAAIHLGDITESNTAEEWAFAKDALAPLRERVPTFLATGNHDYGDGGTANRRHTLFAEYFAKAPAPTKQAVAETLEPNNLENAYYRIQIPQGELAKAKGPLTLGVLVLEWSPRGATVEWANRVLTKYPKDRVVFVTHAYLYYDSTRYDWASKGQSQEWNPHAYGDHHAADKEPADVFDGEKLWNALVSKHKGIFLTLNGHVLGDGTGLLTSRGAAGNLVHQVLANYQMLNEGGLGYLRLLEFEPSGKTLRVRTYSPSFDLWATAPDQQFDLTIDPPLW